MAVEVAGAGCRAAALGDPAYVRGRLGRAGSRVHVPHRPGLGAGLRLSRWAIGARPGDVLRVVRWRCKPVRAGAARRRRGCARHVGCGAGMDTLIAAQMVGPTGSVTGIDITRKMAAKARRSVAEMGLDTVAIVEGSAEQLPFADASFDVVISNGVIDLIPDKDAVFSEIPRVLRPGGRIQLADVTIQRPVSEQQGQTKHRPVGRLNRRGSAGSRVRKPPPAPRIHRHRRPAT